MRWALFLLVLAMALVFDAALMPALEIGGAIPSVTAALVAFVLLLASRDAAWFGAVVAGVALDLAVPIPFEGREIFVIGPWALGFAFAAQLILALRGSLVRRNPLTVAAVTFVLLMSATLVWCAVWSARAWLPASLPPWGSDSVLVAFGERFRWAAWSAAVALLVGWLLLRTVSMWAFPGVAGRTLR